MKILDYKQFEQYEKDNQVICIKDISFKVLNFFKNFTYNVRFNDINTNVRVSYEDGRGATMSKELFDEHFKTI